MKKGRLVIIGVSLFVIIGISMFFFNKQLSAELPIEQSIGEGKDELIMDIFASEISKGIRQSHKINEKSSLGYGIEQFKVIKQTENEHASYDVIVDIKATYDNKNEHESKVSSKDTLKFAVNLDREIQIELVSYKKKGWQ
ncbi:hypothetical protein [Metabacillus fastidiosus]|uniref:DUF3888 domain-containing protein n=1 Tax=Metabacillus fastidiosus TaxID=1458 RepID=A0ABU6P0L4_9BACI|nr:hypothetical protein [Metabacillus fastidiosus]